MRKAIILLTLASALFAFPVALFAQIENPSLIIKDAEGNAYTSHDNSTLMQALPGSLFSMGIEGGPSVPFGLYISYNKTPYPTEFPDPPPPLLLAPPYIPLIVGPSFLLDSSGEFNISSYVPTNFIPVGETVDVYFQAFVLDAVYGFRLTNGITMRIVNSKYKVDLTVGRGNDVGSIFEFGDIRDMNAIDNKIPDGGGPGVENGEPLIPDLSFPFSHYAFDDDGEAPEGYPDPTTSIYLNGIAPLVPGNSGLNPWQESYDRYPFATIHSKVGSSLYRSTRDRVCRSAENLKLQHIIAPVFDDEGVKTHDMNIYHFRDRFTGEYGFLAVDILNNEFYELSGSRKVNDYGGFGSPWDPYVAVSPDGKRMAAVLRGNRDAAVQNWKDNLFVFNLRKNDRWGSNNLHAHPITLNPTPSVDDRIVTRIFADSMVFAGDPIPSILFVVTNKHVKGTNPDFLEPPVENPSIMFKLNTAFEDPQFGNIKVRYINLISGTDMPKAGGGLYPFTYFGSPLVLDHLPKNCTVTDLRCLVAEDYKTVVFRMAGRYGLQDVSGEWTVGQWAYDLLAFTDIVGTDENNLTPHNIVNITGFEEAGPQQGYYILPFGQCYDGRAKAAIGPTQASGSNQVAFVAKRRTTDEDENLYSTSTDGALAGVLQPLNNEQLFQLQENSNDINVGVYDPYFLNEDALVFFCGKKERFQNTAYIPMETDLFLYESNLGIFRNMTTSLTEGPAEETNPPFTTVGDVRPFGLFMSPDNRYMFFFREAPSDSRRMDLVGVDTETDYEIFDLTGSEFSNGIIPSLAHDDGGTTLWGPAAQNVFLAPKEEGGHLLFITAKYKGSAATASHQVFMLDLDYPSAAFPLTAFDVQNERGTIDNLVCDSTGNFLAFSRSNKTFHLNGSDGAYENLYVIDLSKGAFLRNLTPDSNYTNASMDGSLRFINANPDLDIPPQLLYIKGQGGSDELANNPVDARVWLYPLEDTVNPDIPSYPMTEEDYFILFNAVAIP